MSEAKWGGSRPGSGRKKTGAGAVFVSTTISGPPEEIQRLKDNAAAAGQSVSRYVLDRLAQVGPVDQDTERLIAKLQYENYAIKAGRAK